MRRSSLCPRRLATHAAAAAALLLATAPALAQDAGTPFHVDLIVENDSTFNFDREDRQYTSGQAILLGVPSPALAGWMADDLGLPADRAAFGFVAAYQLYTPDNIFLDRPSPGQHPYAGVAYLGGFLQRDLEHAHIDGLTEFDHLQLDLGVVGPSALGEQVQRVVHEFTGGNEPNGWDSQHPDEPIVQLTYRHKWRFDLWRQHRGLITDVPADRATPASWGFDAIPQAGVTAGTLRVQGEASGLLRFGFNLPDDFGPAWIDDLPSATAPRSLPRGHAVSAYVYGQAGGRVVGWDTVIDGPLYRDATFDAESETLVAFARAGVAVGYRWDDWSVEAGYGVSFHTDKLVGQQGQHHFAALTLALTGRF
jgi:hypothetical protein